MAATTLVSGARAAGGDGFYMPAEEEPHARTFMQWAVCLDCYDQDRSFVAEVQATLALIANTISEFEPVVMLAAKSDHAAARRLLSSAVELWDIPTEDLWARDSGPIFVTDGSSLAVRGIRFNGWGGRQRHANDGRIAERVATELGLPYLPTPLKGEGGGIEHDGRSTIIAHESCWVNDNRNPSMMRDEVGAALCDAFGMERVIWAPGLKDHDITDYHIDALARFTAPGEVLINLSDVPDPSEPFDTASRVTETILRDAGLNLTVIPWPDAPRVRDPEFVASYVNHYVCNGAVIASQFGDARTDAIAREALIKAWPGREVIMLNADPLGLVGGGIHCATQQMPRV